jgi:HD superfamily phosphohydrolase
VKGRNLPKAATDTNPVLIGAEQVPEVKTASGRPEVTDNWSEDQFEFLDDIHGAIRLNRLERDLVDSPEFQRLFRLSQLGFVDLVYPTANHTRGTHSIGVCHWSKTLVDILNRNCGQTLNISCSERILIGLGGLLHDIPHGPFSHDIEKKTHHFKVGSETKKVKSYYGPYEKHDNWLANPALYVFLLDSTQSVMARVLRKYSPRFAELLIRDSESHKHLNQFAQLLKQGSWKNYQQELLPQLLFHLLVYEKLSEARECPLRLRISFADDSPVEWGLGPDKAKRQALHEAWYQPFRHDIIGDTLSADLIDYLMRDQARLGMKSQLDLKILNYYILVSKMDKISTETAEFFSCALDLNDDKRGTFRAERLNDIFRLLDLRHQIHEKAVYHRVVQSAIAMLGRSILMMETKPSLIELYGMDGNSIALAGDDRFLDKLVTRGNVSGHLSSESHQSLACKLAERRVYRPLMVVPGDRVPLLLTNLGGGRDNTEQTLRQLAAIIDSPFFSPLLLLIAGAIEKLLAHAIDTEEDLDKLLIDLSKIPASLSALRTMIPKRVIFWTTPYKQLYKDPAIQVKAGDVIDVIEKLRDDHHVSDALKLRVSAGIQDAETKNEALWKFYVFLSDGLFYTGALAKALPHHPCAMDAQNHKKHLDMAERICIRSLRFVWRYWRDKQPTINLDIPVGNEELSLMLPMFVGEANWAIPAGISAVKTDQYLHGDQSEICRDVRYKFDAPKSLDQLLDHVPEVDRSAVREGVGALGLRLIEVPSEELAEIVSMLASDPQALPGLINTAARNSAVDANALRSLWLGKFRLR